MAIQDCGNGHLYDTDLYASCPYCQGGGNRINFGADNFGPQDSFGIGKTMGAGMNFQPLMPPAGAPMGYGDPMMPPPPMVPDGTAFPVANGTVGETVAPKEYRDLKKIEEDTGKTLALYQKKKEYDPVVGWLVCVEGSEKGKDYKFYARANTIGRNDKNDICIKGDNAISRENHARIAYDPKHNSYYLLPGESTNTVYLNDDPVYTSAPLKSYDVIQIGEGKYIVITLCNKKFSWESGVDSGLDI